MLKAGPAHWDSPKEIRQLLHALETLEDPDAWSINIWAELILPKNVGLQNFAVLIKTIVFECSYHGERIFFSMDWRIHWCPRTGLIHVLEEYTWAEIQRENPVIDPLTEAIQLQQWYRPKVKIEAITGNQENTEVMVLSCILYLHDLSVTWQLILSKVWTLFLEERTNMEARPCDVHQTFTWFRRQVMCGSVPAGWINLLTQRCLFIVEDLDCISDWHTGSTVHWL